MIEKTGDLIERDWLLGEIEHNLKCVDSKDKNPTMLFANLAQVVRMIVTAPKVPSVRVPCRVGDTVWVLRNYNGTLHPQIGQVSDLAITRDLRLVITIKHIARGEWGKEVFATYEEAAKVARGEYPDEV